MQRLARVEQKSCQTSARSSFGRRPTTTSTYTTNTAGCNACNLHEQVREREWERETLLLSSEWSCVCGLKEATKKKKIITKKNPGLVFDKSRNRAESCCFRKTHHWDSNLKLPGSSSTSPKPWNQASALIWKQERAAAKVTHRATSTYRKSKSSFSLVFQSRESFDVLTEAKIETRFRGSPADRQPWVWGSWRGNWSRSPWPRGRKMTRQGSSRLLIWWEAATNLPLPNLNPVS